MYSHLLHKVSLLVLLSFVLCDLVKIPLHGGSSIYNKQLPKGRAVRSTLHADKLHGKPGQGYFMQIAVGTPPQMINVLVDTGSSNFAVATKPHPDLDCYFNTSLSNSFEKTGTPVSVPYTQGSWEGFLAKDVISLPSLLNQTIPVSLACIETSDSFFINGSHWQGILGLAYSEISRPDSSVIPVFDALVTNGGIDDIFSLQLCGTLDIGSQTDVSMGGSLILGGIDNELYTGPIVYVPIRKEWYYEVLLTDIYVDGGSLGMQCSEYNAEKTIVDSGTTNLRLPTKVFSQVLDCIKSVVQREKLVIFDEFWNGEETDVLCVEEGQMQWASFPFIELHLAITYNSSFALRISPQQYMRGVLGSYNNYGPQDCFRFAISFSDTGTVLGAVVMEAYYTVFDRGNVRLGFAETLCPQRSKYYKSNMTMPYVISGANFSSCVYTPPAKKRSTLLVVAYVMGGLCGACLIPLIALIIHWQVTKYQDQKRNATSFDQLTNSLLTEEVIS